MISYGASSVYRTLENAQEEVDKLNSQLEPLPGRIDEVALLVDGNDQLYTLDTLLCRDFGWERFNIAHDNVRTAPIRSAYDVEYHFYRHHDKEWRLEVMRLTGGISPLHAAIPPPLSRQVCAPVHVSFKLEDEELYAYSRTYLGALGYVLAQQCDSAYGRFSYFTKLGLPVPRVPYVKPRVNLRDATPQPG